MAKQKKEQAALDIIEIEAGVIRFGIVGLTPMLMRRMSQKAAGELLLPKGKKSAAEKASSLKHEPLVEYRDSPYRAESPDAPTEIEQLSTCFKNALRGAALDFPGASKAQIGRLVWVEGERVSIYGVPQIHLGIVRSADMNRTPDVRTRLIIPRWACIVSLRYTKPLLNEKVIINLMGAAGLTQGIGDWRPQKGSGNFGQFRLASMNDPELVEIMATGGRAAQLAALESPQPYDRETEELLAWFDAEVEKRGIGSRLSARTGEVDGNRDLDYVAPVLVEKPKAKRKSKASVEATAASKPKGKAARGNGHARKFP